MADNILDRAYRYIKSISKEELIKELKECGLENYLLDKNESDYSMQPFETVCKNVYSVSNHVYRISEPAVFEQKRSYKLTYYDKIA